MSKSIKSFVITSSSFALILSLSTALWGGTTGKIAGRIADAATGEPLAGANVMIVGTTLGAAADAEGDYFIINVPPGTYEVQSTMIGYQALTLTEVIVRLDLTTPVDFNLTSTVIVGEAVTVTGEREVIKMDQSASAVNASITEIETVPMVKDISEYIALQAGIEGDIIRGGSLDQTAFMLDGLMVVDNRTNSPMMMVNLSSIKEISIIKGGFNAEYGNIRSGLINVITREGSPTEYHGSIDFRYRPAGLKHPGASVFSPDNYYLRPYLDPEVCWVGTEVGWSEEPELQEKYKSFMGWNKYAELTEGDRTPEQCRDMFMWLHRTEGSGALGQKEGEYGHKPDWFVDASLGGPVPLLSKYLGNLSFFASYRTNREMFALPTNREYYEEDNIHLKVTSRLSPSMKLTLEGLYGEINSVHADDRKSPIPSGDAMLNDSRAYGGDYFYSPSDHVPFDVYRSMQGLSFDHVLSPRTFYNVRISNIHTEDLATGAYKWRDTTTVRFFGKTPVTEAPYGYWSKTPPEQVIIAGAGANMRADARSASEESTINFKFDLTSQIDKYNQVKFGLEYTYSDIYEYYAKVDDFCPGDSWSVEWHQYPYRLGGYLQDKLEFEGMIANFGLRLDYNEPNAEWYTVERYSRYFSKPFMDVFTEITPKEEAKGHVKISPRLGISHPISENAKLYFNYGHFYSMAKSSDMYSIEYGSQARGIAFIGNPSADLPRTVAYELGLEYNLLDMFMVHLSGYYKDVTDQTGDVAYTNYDKSVNYETTENNNYEDIRGFELKIDKRFGRWITGWLNYNYMVETSGFIGREHYYQDEREQRIHGMQNPYQEIPLARPVFRANVMVGTPNDFGPTVAGIKPFGDIRFSTVFTWKAGSYQTWDPLETGELVDNLQWNARYNFDARVDKLVRLGGYSIELFVDIKNLFNTEYIYSQGFFDDNDRKYYFDSLKLPMYAGRNPEEAEAYAALNLKSGDDSPGDIKSDDKPYINMPNRDHLTFLNQRSIIIGLKLAF